MVNTPARDHRDKLRQQAVDRQERAKLEGKELEFALNCDEGRGSVGACTSLAEWYMLVQRDFGKAAKLFYPACFERNYGQACLLFGKVLLTGRPGVSPDLKLASAALERGCAGGNSEACFMSGSLALTAAVQALGAGGDGTSSSISGELPTCDAAERERMDGFRGEIQRPPAIASATVDPATPSFPISSDAAAALESAREALRRSERLLLQGCWGKSLETAASGPSCYLLASLHLDPRFAPLLLKPRDSRGDDVVVNLGARDSHQQQLQLQQQQCVVTLSGRELDANEAAVAFDPIENLKRGCSGESEKACKALAHVYRYGHPPDVGKNPAAARRYMHKYLMLKGVPTASAERELDKTGW